MIYEFDRNMKEKCMVQQIRYLIHKILSTLSDPTNARPVIPTNYICGLRWGPAGGNQPGDGGVLGAASEAVRRHIVGGRRRSIGQSQRLGRGDTGKLSDWD